MLRTLLKSKIHRARVTRADLHYEGSISIDAALMKAADLVPHEHVHVWNVTNGKRFETYAIPAERIKGHRDQEITSCPGATLYARLDEVRRAATATNGLYASTRRAGVVMEEPAW